jgi:hypothetical protein
VSAIPSRRDEAREAVAGLMASASILVGAIGLAHRPGRIVPFAVLLALASARMTTRHATLARWAVYATVVWWTLGMTIAVVTQHPIF